MTPSHELNTSNILFKKMDVGEGELLLFINLLSKNDMAMPKVQHIYYRHVNKKTIRLLFHKEYYNTIARFIEWGEKEYATTNPYTNANWQRLKIAFKNAITISEMKVQSKYDFFFMAKKDMAVYLN